MKQVDWNEVQKFTPDEFPEDPDLYARPKIIYRLDKFRLILGDYVYPSPAAGGLARFDVGSKGSRHCARGKRRSDAVDVFPEGNPGRALLIALTCQLFGGVGLYLDTEYEGHNWPMLHLDLRPLGTNHADETALLWVRRDGQYTYPQYGEQHCSNILIRALRWATNYKQEG